MQIPDCIICQETVRVPVQLICFPCGNKKPKSFQNPCNEIIRVCLLCARKYLQLNLSNNRRSVSKKCLMCPTTINPQTLGRAEYIYRKDKILMSMDIRTDIPCFHAFCTFKGSQNELDRHIQHECMFRTIFCQAGCGAYFVAHTENNHKKNCSRYTLCPFCPDVYFSEFTSMERHVLETHQKKVCPDCNSFFDQREMPRHVIKCPNRKDQCKICKDWLLFKDMSRHIQDHIRSFNKHISRLTEQLEEAIQEINKYV